MIVDMMNSVGPMDSVGAANATINNKPTSIPKNIYAISPPNIRKNPFIYRILIPSFGLS